MTSPQGQLRFDPTDPLTFPLAFKSWIVKYVQQELLITELTGFKTATAAPPLSSLNAYRNVIAFQSVAFAKAATTDSIMLQRSLTLGSGPSDNTAGQGVFYVDPDDYAVTGFTQEMAIRVNVIAGTVAPATTFVFTLRPVTAVSGVVGASNRITIGSAITTLTFTTPAANAITTQDTGDFVFPSVGPYVIAVTWASDMAASSQTIFEATVRARTK